MLTWRRDCLFGLLLLVATCGSAQVGTAEVDTMIARYKRLVGDSLRIAPIDNALRAAKAIGYRQGEADVLFDKGMVHFRSPQYDSADHYVRQAMALYQAINHPAKERVALNRLGVIWYFKAAYDSAISHYQGFRQLSEEAGDTANIASAHFNIALCFEQLGLLDSAVNYYEQSRLLRQASGNVDKELKAIRRLTNIYYSQDQFDTARHLLLSALRFDDGTRDSSRFSLDYFELGRIAFRTSDLVEALRYYQEAYTRRGMVALDAYYHNVGLIYSAIEDNEKAMECFRRALAIRAERGDSLGMAETYQAIGGSLFTQEMDSVDWYYGEALRIFEGRNHRRALSSLHENMGKYYFSMDDLETAKHHYRECIAIGSEAETQADIYLARAYLGKICEVEEDTDMAEDYLLESHRWFLDKGIKDYASTTAGFLADLYAAKGRHKEAYDYQRQAHELSHEILNAQSITEIGVLRYRMAVEQEEETARLLDSERERMYEANLSMARRIRNIAIGSAIVAILIIIYILRLVAQRRKINQDLNRQNGQLNSLANHLTETLREKEILYKEIHHRVKNNLQIILSLLNSAQAMVEDEEARDVLQQSRHRVNSMALIHKNLYQSGNMEKVHAHDYILEIVREIEHSFATKRARAKINTNVEDVFLELNVAIPVGLILNELITNAFKYAFASDRQNEMNIELRVLGEERYRVEVHDNGPGLPQGFSPLESEKLGFQLIKGLTRQINGEFRYNSNGGLQVQIDFAGN